MRTCSSGLLYESVVRVPDRLCSRVLAAAAGEPQSVRSLLRLGNPALYFQPINNRLFMAAEPPDADERAELLRWWYRLNAIRLALVGAAWASAGRARSRLAART